MMRMSFTLFDGRVAELVDALASGASGRKAMRVRVPPRPPNIVKSCVVGIYYFQRQLVLMYQLVKSRKRSDGWLMTSRGLTP